MNVSVIFLGFPMGFPQLFLCLPVRGIPMSTISSAHHEPRSHSRLAVGALGGYHQQTWANLHHNGENLLRIGDF